MRAVVAEVSRWRWVGLLVAGLVGLVGPVGAQESGDEAAPARLGNCQIAGVDVSGQTAEEARQTLFDALRDRRHFECVVTDGVKQARRGRMDLGIYLDLDGMIDRGLDGETVVPLMLFADVDEMQAAFERLADFFAYPGENARPVREGDKVRIYEGQYRRRIDARASAERLAPTVEDDPTTVRFSLTLIKSPPEVSAADLAGIDAVIGQYTTRFDPGQVGRTTNLRLAVSAIHTRLLKRGEVFSLNETVGERTPARGYRKAVIFQGGRMIEGYGGGVSQVTGTLFNAALEAGLTIVTYRVHSRPVTYLPLGRDATVAWGQFDMKFRNSTAAPIYIDYQAPGNRCVVTLFGAAQPGLQVKVETAVRRPGPRHVIASLFRTIRQPDGTSKRTHLGTSEYRWPADNTVAHHD